MKKLVNFLNEQLHGVRVNETEESVKDEKSFRDYAKNKFKEVFGDKLDKKRMKFTIDGIISNNKSAVEKGDWGKLIGILNKSFGS